MSLDDGARSVSAGRLPYPTPRAAALAGAGIATAFALGLAAPERWPLGFLASALTAVAVMADFILARRPADIDAQVRAPALMEQGTDADVTVQALVRGGPPPALQAALLTGDRIVAAPRSRTLTAEPAMFRLRAVRLGRAALGPLQLRWTGPLGLVRRARTLALEGAVLVTPDLAAARAASRALGADASGGPRLDARLGQGGEFRALRAYSAGDDRRMIDWKRSASRGALLVKEFQLEQNHPVVLAIDCGRSMTEPIGLRPRLDYALSAALALAYAGLTVGDRMKLCGFDARVGVESAFVAGRASFTALQAAGAQLDYSAEATNYTLALHTIASRLDRRSLVVMFTEFTDTVGAELMLESVARLVRRHVVLFVVFRDAELEALVSAVPHAPEDVSRAVVAATLLRERAQVLERLKRMGVRPVQTTPDRVGGAVIDAYIDLKRRDLG